MSTSTIYKNWFDEADLIAPFKAIGETDSVSGEGKTMESHRFHTKGAAIAFFNKCYGRCIVSHRNYATKTTRILAYKFQ